MASAALIKKLPSVCFLMLLAWQASGCKQQPVIQLPAGVVVQVSSQVPEVSSSFILKNTGNEGLILKSVTSDCNCLVSTFTRKTIAPGDTGSVHFNYYYDVSPNTADTSFYRKMIIIANTEPRINHLQFQVKAKK